MIHRFSHPDFTDVFRRFSRSAESDFVVDASRRSRRLPLPDFLATKCGEETSPPLFYRLPLVNGEAAHVLVGEADGFGEGRVSVDGFHQFLHRVF